MPNITLAAGLTQKLQVSMTPAKTLAQALSEFCAKFDLDACEYTLSHNKKELDLSLSWRLSGISANATLDVRKSATSSKAGTSNHSIVVTQSTLILSLSHSMPRLATV